MGQYYRVLVGDTMGIHKELYTTSVKLANDEIVYDGEKLMEHSYVDNAFTMGVASMFLHHPKRLIWVGDYSDEVALGDERYLADTKNFKGVDVPVYAEAWPLELAHEERPVKEAPAFTWKGLKFINHDKKVYVDMDTYIKNNTVKVSKWLDCISPLSLLTVVGNGRGGGDYRGTDMDKVGTWAWNLVELAEEVPEGYDEIIPVFKEG